MGAWDPYPGTCAIACAPITCAWHVCMANGSPCLGLNLRRIQPWSGRTIRRRGTGAVRRRAVRGPPSSAVLPASNGVLPAPPVSPSTAATDVSGPSPPSPPSASHDDDGRRGAVRGRAVRSPSSPSNADDRRSGRVWGRGSPVAIRRELWHAPASSPLWHGKGWKLWSPRGGGAAHDGRRRWRRVWHGPTSPHDDAAAG